MSERAAIREALAAMPADVSNDAIGSAAPRLDEFYAPAAHAAALDPATTIVLGARGAGKSFWAGALGQADTRAAAQRAYPRLELSRCSVAFGYTGLDARGETGPARIERLVPEGASAEDARNFWWGTVLAAIAKARAPDAPDIGDPWTGAHDLDARLDTLDREDRSLETKGRHLLIVYDALDTVATSWPRRRLLTQALLEVVWAMRAYRSIKVKVFLRPDQIEDDQLRFVELPKLTTGAMRLTWSQVDLYGMLFARLARGQSGGELRSIVRGCGLGDPSDEDILTRRWSLCRSPKDQKTLMGSLAGPYMSSGPHGYKKGNTYDWPIKHLGDAFEEVTPRSFLGLMIAAAQHTHAHPDRVIRPDGIRHGLRAASRTRVDQLHQEFPWIKGVLTPMAGLLLPQEEEIVFEVWRSAGTVDAALNDARQGGYLPPFPDGETHRGEFALYRALEQIGVMFRRRDGRLDMPDLFRVAAKLLKKGGTAPA